MWTCVDVNVWTCVDVNVCICVLFLIYCIDSLCASYLVSVPGLHVYCDVNLEYLLSTILVYVFLVCSVFGF